MRWDIKHNLPPSTTDTTLPPTYNNIPLYNTQYPMPPPTVHPPPGMVCVYSTGITMCNFRGMIWGIEVIGGRI